MNRETTSKEARISPSCRTCEWMNSVKLREFRTCEGELPTKGNRIVAKCFDSWYVGACTKDTMGHNGTSGLCTFGKPYKRRSHPVEDCSLSYRASGMEPDFFNHNSMPFIFCSRPGVGSWASFLYVFGSSRRLLIFPSYSALSITTVARPLSAGEMRSYFWRFLTL